MLSISRFFSFSLVLLLSFSLRAQGEAALTFLEMPTDAECTGLAFGSTAHLTSNPLAVLANPAHLGMQSFVEGCSFGRGYSDWMPGYTLDLWIRTYAAFCGTNLQKYFPSLPPISIGAGYSQLYVNYGNFVRTGENGPEAIGTFTSYDKSDQWTFSAGIDYYLKVSAGITYKHIHSKLADPPSSFEQSNGSATVNLYDLGLLVEAPFIELLSSAINKDFSITQNIYPVCNLTFGLANKNLGAESIYYIDKSQSSPLPRTVSAGIELNIGINHRTDMINWMPFSFKWVAQANDWKVENAGDGSYAYQTGMGDIDFFKEVIRGEAGLKTERIRGWEINLAEFVSIYGGTFNEDVNYGNRHFNTSGWRINSSGIIKIISVYNPDFLPKDIFGYIIKGLNLSYGESRIDAKNEGSHTSPVKGTEFNSFLISFRF